MGVYARQQLPHQREVALLPEGLAPLRHMVEVQAVAVELLDLARRDDDAGGELVLYDVQAEQEGAHERGRVAVVRRGLEGEEVHVLGGTGALEGPAG